MEGLPGDFAAVVRAHHANATGWILARREPCLSIRKEEIRVVRRNLRPLGADDLHGFRPAGSWMLAVLMCPGDDMVDVVSWVLGLPLRDRSRVRFYHHPRVDPMRALAAWRHAGLEDPPVDEVSDFRAFHRRFGQDLNSQVYRDALGIR